MSGQHQPAGLLTAVRDSGKRKGNKIIWECRCDCGGTAEVVSERFISGETRSCGCLLAAQVRERDMAAVTAPKPLLRTETPAEAVDRLRKVHLAMWVRCYDPEAEKYPSYGARGIRVCDRWQGPGGFDRFLADMGLPPSADHSIERKDNDGNYEPGNCRWATDTEQARNRRSSRWVEYQGKRWVLAALAESLGVSYKRLHKWLQKLGDINAAVERTLNPGRYGEATAAPVASRFHQEGR